ncbi:unnamed protein product [Linum trigynum]|uniref:Uncharacterized protein n=1 Tax=Linum trigynum TaxID=586398 RepID=A0AAV2GLW0_9ROSI
MRIPRPAAAALAPFNFSHVQHLLYASTSSLPSPEASTMTRRLRPPIPQPPLIPYFSPAATGKNHRIDHPSHGNQPEWRNPILNKTFGDNFATWWLSFAISMSINL